MGHAAFLRGDKMLKETHKKHQLRDSFISYYQTLGEVYPKQNLIQVLFCNPELCGLRVFTCLGMVLVLDVKGPNLKAQPPTLKSVALRIF